MTLKQSQREAIQQISDAVALFRRQSDSTFGGKAWSAVSWPKLSAKWEALIREQIELLQRLKSGAFPQWKIKQDSAYESSAIGQLMKRKEHGNEREG